MNGNRGNFARVLIVLLAAPLLWPTNQSPPKTCLLMQPSYNSILTQYSDNVYDRAIVSRRFQPRERSNHGVLARQEGKVQQNSKMRRTITPPVQSVTSRHSHVSTLDLTTQATAVFAQLRETPIESVEHHTADDFILTAYALSVQSTGKSPNSPGFGITYSGTHATLSRTVAVDPNVIPIGSLLYIPGVGWRVAEDTGGGVKGRHIDVLLPSDEQAMQFGVKRHVRIYYIPPTDAIERLQVTQNTNLSHGEED